MQGALKAVALILFLAAFCDAFLENESPSRNRRRHVLRTASNDRSQSRRWNGNYKTASKRLADIPKKKKIKLNLVANGVKKIVEKKRQETLQHVLTKAVIWKLFMDEYPNLEIEHDIGDPDYLPDVIDASVKEDIKKIAFWAEAGRMKVHKAVDLMQRYPETHIVQARWGMTLEDISKPLEDYLLCKFESGELDLSKRSGRFTFCSLPLDVWRFIDDESGVISVEKEDLEWKELSFPE